MNITEQDTFDTLKHGYIPLDSLFEYVAKEANMAVMDFVNQFDDDCGEFTYTKDIPLLWDGDYYSIQLYMSDPSSNSEIDTTEVVFNCQCFISDEEKRYFPPMCELQEVYQITSREKFKEVLFEWKEFVGKSYLEIFRNRLDILADLDRIVDSELELKKYPGTKDKIKLEYIHWLSLMPLKMASVVEEMVYFEGNNEHVR